MARKPAPPRTDAAARWLSADESAALLGVTKATLYAYVSRGKLASSPGERHGTRRYRRSAVERLVAQRGAAREPRQVARSALAWGLPVLESSLTLIERQQLHYRGVDARSLAARAGLEDVAALLWQLPIADAFPDAPPPRAQRPRRTVPTTPSSPAAERMLAAFVRLTAARERPAGGRRSADTRTAAEAGALLRLASAAALDAAAPAAEPVHQQFARAWSLSATGADALRAAFVLCADHELNASSFVARCVASTGAELAASVVAGLAALSGGLHGGATERVEAMWEELARATSPRAGLERLLARGDAVAGFGHPLYPDADPRATEILARLPVGPATRFAARIARAVDDATGLRPTVDFALVALRRAVGAPEGAAYRIFAVGRTVGWLAHALEQRTVPGIIRPRAAYVGPTPQANEASGKNATGAPRAPSSVFAADLSVSRRGTRP